MACHYALRMAVCGVLRQRLIADGAPMLGAVVSHRSAEEIARVSCRQIRGSDHIHHQGSRRLAFVESGAHIVARCNRGIAVREGNSVSLERPDEHVIVLIR